MGKIIRLGTILMVFCVVSAAGLAYVYMFTQPQIEANAKLAYEKSVKEVLPKEGKAVAVSPRGYSSTINLLVGIDAQGKVIGIKVLDQKETPGLGASIVKPDFLKQFIGKSARDPIEVKNDVDAITGATISSRAVCKGVREALEKK
ncbi:MAG: FMN-binding protein [Candidatus Margulisiibacteriota bacterium]